MLIRRSSNHSSFPMMPHSWQYNRIVEASKSNLFWLPHSSAPPGCRRIPSPTDAPAAPLGCAVSTSQQGGTRCAGSCSASHQSPTPAPRGRLGHHAPTRAARASPCTCPLVYARGCKEGCEDAVKPLIAEAPRPVVGYWHAGRGACLRRAPAHITLPNWEPVRAQLEPMHDLVCWHCGSTVVAPAGG